MRRFRISLLLLIIAALVAPAAKATTSSSTVALSALDQVLSNASGRVVTHASPETGAFDFVRARRGSYLWRDGAVASFESRARAFLSRYGELVGMSAAERRVVRSAATPAGTSSALSLLRIESDAAGKRHARFEQRNRGNAVFGAQIVVHMDAHGVTAVNGHFIPAIAGSAKPTIVAADARARAIDSLVKQTPRKHLKIESTGLQWYHLGLITGQAGSTVLAYDVKVAGAEHGRQQVWIDATTGDVLNTIELQSAAKERLVYTPQFDRRNPDMFVVRKEGDPKSNIPPVDNLYDFSGQVYDFFAKGFDRDSWDGKGIPMRTVELVNSICPNAYWNGATTNYCPGFDLDDVVAHEWGHAYTDRTHGLIYQCQSGALNESYSDIWGEAIDLTNGVDGVGGAVNDKPYPDGRRWILGEDFSDPAQEVLLRDMWDPARLGDPDKVSSANYVCANNNDNGGVHINSGIPNHAFVMLVDGKTYNGQTVAPIGLTRASHLYYQAMEAYQTPATKFAAHEQALLASCDDLQGVNVKSPLTGEPSGEPIEAGTCAQVVKAMKAVEMSKEPPQCQFGRMLAKNAPTLCPGATTIFTDGFSDGLGNWTLASSGLTADWPKTNWVTTSSRVKNLPASTPTLARGAAAYAVDAEDGTCEPGNDAAGTYSMTSKSISIPQGAEHSRLRFDHYMATENADAGNVLVGVNGGEFTVVPASAFIFNAPAAALPEPLPGGNGSANPKSGELAWFGTDGGEATGSWGTSVIDLSKLAKPGDQVALRFEFGLDCGGGTDGWYVDNVLVYDCPVLPSPTDITFTGVTERAASAPFTISWTRPPTASGPDTVQESSVSCAPLLSEDAESGLTRWEPSMDGVGAQGWTTDSDKPEHDSTTFRVRGLPGTTNTSSYLTYKESIPIPAGSLSTLTFKDWHANEGDDQVRVEVSRDGTTWQPIYNNARSDLIPSAAVALLTEPMVDRSADLSRFAGSSVKLRLHYKLGGEDRLGSGPIGWYVDDLLLVSEKWSNVATVAGTSALVSRHASGTVCYRVQTAYKINGKHAPSLWSAPSASVAVKAFGSLPPPPPRVPQVRGVKQTALPATGVESTLRLGLALLLCAAAFASIIRAPRTRAQ